MPSWSGALEHVGPCHGLALPSDGIGSCIKDSPKMYNFVYNFVYNFGVLRSGIQGGL